MRKHRYRSPIKESGPRDLTWPTTPSASAEIMALRKEEQKAESYQSVGQYICNLYSLHLHMAPEAPPSGWVLLDAAGKLLCRGAGMPHPSIGQMAGAYHLLIHPVIWVKVIKFFKAQLDGARDT